MPHQCVHCGKIYPNAASELLTGCTCKSKFFFYIKNEQYSKIGSEIPIISLDAGEKKKIESDVRQMIGANEEEPVVLDLESVRVVSQGKFEIDIVNLFKRDRPIIFKLEEGKYIIDLASTFKQV